MRSIMCQDLTFFFLAVLLLVINGSASSAQHMDAGSAPQMGETSATQMVGSSPSQTGGNYGSQSGGNYGSQASGSPGPQASSNYGSQTSGNYGLLTGGFSESQTGERSRSQMGGKNSFSLNASNGSPSTVAHAGSSGIGRRDADVDVQNWRGMASKDGESYPVRLSVETILTLDPDVARDLLSSNLSLEDIRSHLSNINKNAILRGSLRIRSDSYQLVSITMESSANESILQADLARPSTTYGAENESETVGHISVTIFADDLEVARGYAVIDESRYHGTYDLELEMQSGRGYVWGMLGRES